MQNAKSEKIKKIFAFNIDIFKDCKKTNKSLIYYEKNIIILNKLFSAKENNFN